MNLYLDIRKVMILAFLMYSFFLYKFVSHRLGDEAVLLISASFLVCSFFLVDCSKSAGLKNIWLILLVVWICLSTFWSENFETTFLRGGTLLVSIATVAVLVDIGGKKLKQTLTVFVFLAVLLNLLSFVLLPQYAFRSGNVSGLMYSKNDLGLMMGICLLFMYLEVGMKGIVNKVIVFLALIVLVLVQAKTVMAIIVGFLIIDLAVRNKRIVFGFINAARIKKIIQLISLVLLLVFGMQGIEWIVKSIEESAMTGRGYIWKLALSKDNAGGMIGYGYGVNWLDENLISEGLNTVSTKWLVLIENSHNGYIDIYSSLGIVGLGLLLIYIKSVFSMANGEKLVVYTSLFMVIHNFTESTWFVSMHFLFVFYLMIVCMRKDNYERC